MDHTIVFGSVPVNDDESFCNYTINQLEKQFNRYLSFYNYPAYNINVYALIKCGFFYTGEDHIIQCFNCLFKLANFKVPLNPGNPLFHAYNCKFAFGVTETEGSNLTRLCFNPMVKPGLPDLLINLGENWNKVSKHFAAKRPLNTQMSTLTQRFNNLLQHSKQLNKSCFKLKQIAKAGFYFDTDNKCYCCFYCNVKINRFPDKNTAFKLHADKNNACAFLIKRIGPHRATTPSLLN